MQLATRGHFVLGSNNRWEIFMEVQNLKLTWPGAQHLAVLMARALTPLIHLPENSTLKLPYSTCQPPYSTWGILTCSLRPQPRSKQGNKRRESDCKQMSLYKCRSSPPHCVHITFKRCLFGLLLRSHGCSAWLIYISLFCHQQNLLHPFLCENIL